MVQWTIEGDVVTRRIWLEGDPEKHTTYGLELDPTDDARWVVLQNGVAIGKGKRQIVSSHVPLAERRTLEAMPWSVEGEDKLLLRRVLFAWEAWCKQTKPPLGPSPHDWTARYGGAPPLPDLAPRS